MSKKKIGLALVLLVLGGRAFAQEIHCVARQFEVTHQGNKNQQEKRFVIKADASEFASESVDLGSRAFSFSANLSRGDFMLTQSWGENYTEGINATGSFDSTGRMQISQVIVNQVYKFECRRR